MTSERINLPGGWYLARQHVDGMWMLFRPEDLSLRQSERDEDVRTFAAALQQQQPQALAGGEWQPIETAPRDGRRLLAIVDGDVRLVAWSKTSHVPIWGWCIVDQGVEDADLCAPSVWTSLPAAPTLDQGSER